MKCSSRKTLWRTFDSCNNYKIPQPIPKVDTQMHYWYADGEEKERKLDIAYMNQHFPQTEFKVLPKLGHAGLVLLKPDLFETDKLQFVEVKQLNTSYNIAVHETVNQIGLLFFLY